MSGEYTFTVIATDGVSTGKAYAEEELSCNLEGCNGTQYIVDWEDGDTTIVCGKSLEWIDDHTAKII